MIFYNEVKCFKGEDASKPTTGMKFGYLYYATDSSVVYLWSGTAWIPTNLLLPLANTESF